MILFSVTFIIILGFAVYGNSLNNGFIWDDQILIKDNSYVKGWSSLPQIFTQDIGAGAGKKTWKFYRPLQMITYIIDYSLWKSDAKGYHLTSILWHVLAALSIYVLMNMIFKDNLLSFLTGALFIVHPVHTEVVTYISGRADSMALLFMLMCFIFYIKSSPSKRVGTCILMLFSYALALLSKESSLILPVLLLLYHYSFKKKVHIKNFFLIVGISLIYVLLRVTVFKAILPDVTNTATLGQRLPGVFAAITSYVRLLFLPLDLHMEYGHPLFRFSDPKCILGMSLLLALLTVAFRKREDSPLISFSLSWFFIALLPVLNLYPINAYMAEHWLYLPSIGFFLVAAKGLQSFYKVQALRILAVSFVIGLLAWHSYLTVKQNVYWREPLLFFQRLLKYAPDSARVYYNLGNEYHNNGEDEEAIAAWKKAIEIRPDYETAYNNLGNTYLALNKGGEAISAYKKAIEIKNDHANAYYNLGNAYFSINKIEEAIASWKKATEIKKDYKEAYHNLAVIYFQQKQYNLAIENCDRAKELGIENNELLKVLQPYRVK